MTDEINRRFQCFNKQVDAFELQNKSKIKKRCFSVEYPFLTVNGLGLRRFIVEELMAFWIWYRFQYSGSRHFYELIQEGYPCRLYFDLEYNKEDNKDIVLNTILNDFIKLVNELVDEHYGFKITKKNWLILGSTTEVKFSAHATVHFPDDFIFPNNVAMRVFIQALLQKMSDTGIGIVKKGSEETFICDSAVYTKNRCFRLYLSSKAGKTTILNLMKGCCFYSTKPKDDLQIFYDSLVIPPNYEKCPIIRINENPHIVLKQTRMNGVNKTKAISEYVSKNLKKIPTYNPGSDIEIINISSGISPLEELDKYIVEFNEKLANMTNIVIRQWTYFILKSSGSKRIQYQFVNCRYCIHLGRQHKSQNIYWTVALDNMVMFQRCFDCREFISNHFQLPDDLVKKITPKIDESFKNNMNTENMSNEDAEHYKKSLNDTQFSLNLEEASMFVNYDSDSDIEILESKIDTQLDSFNNTSLDREFEKLQKNKKKEEISVNRRKSNKLKKIDNKQSSILNFSKPIIKNNSLIDLTDEVNSPDVKRRKITITQEVDIVNIPKKV